jgi:hypothetical protein
MGNVVAWIRTALERSKSCLFDITLQLPEDDAAAYMPTITNVMMLVVQHVHRLRRLAVSANSLLSRPEEMFALLQNAQRAPRLAILELTFSDPNPTSTMTIPPGGLLLQAPSLTSLRLHGVTTSPVPFVGLRSLNIQGLRTTYADFRDMAAASPLLTDLILPKLRLMVDLQSKSLPPIQISSLKILAVSFCKPPPSNLFTPCHNLISLLHIPNLEYLELSGGAMPDLAKCFDGPSTFTKLRTLRLVGLAIFQRASPTEPEIDNSEYLRAFTTVEDLQLVHSHAEYLMPIEKKARRRRFPRTSSISNLRDTNHLLSRPFFERPEQVVPLRVLASSQGQLNIPDSEVAIYPNLRTLSLDTLLANEVVWLYQLISSRPQIKVVKLSAVAERHLATSLGNVDGVLQTLRNSHKMQPGAPHCDPVDVLKLLRERVTVEEIEPEVYIPWQGAVI